MEKKYERCGADLSLSAAHMEFFPSAVQPAIDFTFCYTGLAHGQGCCIEGVKADFLQFYLCYWSIWCWVKARGARNYEGVAFLRGDNSTVAILIQVINHHWAIQSICISISIIIAWWQSALRQKFVIVIAKNIPILTHIQVLLTSMHRLSLSPSPCLGEWL